MAPCDKDSILVLSPHLDDAVISCASVIAEARSCVVATVFAGIPPPSVQAAAWDGKEGSASDAVRRRRGEDLEAVTLLGARVRHFPFVESAYRSPNESAASESGDGPGSLLSDLRRSIRSLVNEVSPDTCYIPLGLRHSDHLLTSMSATAIHYACEGVRVVFYADQPYAYYMRPSEIYSRLRHLRLAASSLTPRRLSPEAAERKRTALAMYKSQLPALDEAFPLWGRAMEEWGEAIMEVPWVRAAPE